MPRLVQDAQVEAMVGNVKNGLSVEGEYLAGVDSLAAANCENHVRVRNFWLEHLNILDRCFAAVPERTDDFDSGFFSRCDYLVLRCGECVLAADYRRLFAVCRADFFYILICVRAYRISGKSVLFILYHPFRKSEVLLFALGVLFDVFSVLVYTDRQERYNNYGDGEISAVAVAVFDNICKTDERNGHRQYNNERRNNCAAHSLRLDLLNTLWFSKRATKPKVVVTPVEMRHRSRQIP